MSQRPSHPYRDPVAHLGAIKLQSKADFGAALRAIADIHHALDAGGFNSYSRAQLADVIRSLTALRDSLGLGGLDREYWGTLLAGLILALACLLVPLLSGAWRLATFALAPLFLWYARDAWQARRLLRVADAFNTLIESFRRFAESKPIQSVTQVRVDVQRKSVTEDPLQQAPRGHTNSARKGRRR